MAQQTPAQVEMQQTSTSPANVKIEMGGGLPMQFKLANAFSLIIAGVVAVAVTAVLADGMSVIKVKDASELPVITNPAYKTYGIDHNVAELLGETYGIGLHHDQSGRGWTKIGGQRTVKVLEDTLGIPVIGGALPSVISTDGLKHPVPLLSCNSLQAAGLSAMSLGFIADAVAIVMIIFHTLALVGMIDPKMVQPVASLVWAVLVIGFLVVCLLAVGIYTATWTCHNSIIPRIRISDHFDMNYGYGFAFTGYVSCLLVLAVSVAFNTISAPTAAPAKAGGIIALGVVVMAISTISVAAGNSAFEADPPVDPDYNPCKDQKPKAGLMKGDDYFKNIPCFKENVRMALEQAGGNVTKGFIGDIDASSRQPITVPYSQTDLCPVNVHWHLGAEHLSVGEFDLAGSGPVDHVIGEKGDPAGYSRKRELAQGEIRLGNRCHKYNAADPKFDQSTFNWQHCTNMMVGETYEIHWPHSAAGMCGTEWQYQSPFYDGVFCRDGIIKVAPLNTFEKIGVQGQVYTVINDENYYYPNLIDGMITDSNRQAATNPAMFATAGKDMSIYTGSTTGTSRTNDLCSRYTPITWQVDRECHLISASSFDKLCQDMAAKKADMSDDYYPHGARITVSKEISANNQYDAVHRD